MSVPASDPGRMLRAFGALATRVGHLDNTGAPCRISWDGEHDCCYVCNVVGVLLESLREHDLDADALIARMPDLAKADMRAADRVPEAVRAISESVARAGEIR